MPIPKTQYQANNIKQVNAKQCNTEKVTVSKASPRLNRQANGSGKEFKPREVDTCDSHLNDRHLKDLRFPEDSLLICILSRMQL
jgi:hypothetical protein